MPALFGAFEHGLVTQIVTRIVTQSFSSAPRSPALRHGRAAVAVLALGALLAGCAANNPDDPLEPVNRKVHGFNKGLDTVVLKPTSQVYGTVLPEPARNGVSNFAANLGLPSKVLNNLLQGRIEEAGQNGFRFLVNSTFGLAGFLDPAADMGLTEIDTDFGETLHRWGAGEGAYVELPVLGPSTGRDTAGWVVDLVTDPVNTLGGDTRQAATGSDVLSRVGDRYKYSDTVDSILYGSADSYAQARQMYLQNRRFKLGQEVEATDEYDPYEDPYAQ